MEKEYGSIVDPNGDLVICKFTEDEDYTPLALKLCDAKKTDVRRVASQVFDSENELMEFIQQKRLECDKSHSWFFQTVAYEIVDEHHIRLYYNIIVSNA